MNWREIFSRGAENSPKLKSHSAESRIPNGGVPWPTAGLQAPRRPLRRTGRWHIGRLAVAKEMRGRHIATELLKTAAAFVFDQGVDSIYMEARDITVAIVQKMAAAGSGGEPVPFYEGTVTPVMLEKERFL